MFKKLEEFYIVTYKDCHTEEKLDQTVYGLFYFYSILVVSKRNIGIKSRRNIYEWYKWSTKGEGQQIIIMYEALRHSCVLKGALLELKPEIWEGSNSQMGRVGSTLG